VANDADIAVVAAQLEMTVVGDKPAVENFGRLHGPIIESEATRYSGND